MTEAPGISVLHVDDDPVFADLTANMLSEQEIQFTVETATNASEGLDRLAASGFDCIVSDYEMPGQDGIEFLETVREEYPNLPFILYTGKGSEAVAGDAIAAGVTDYLQKEIGKSQYAILANKIRNAVESRRQQKRAQATRDRLRQIIDMLPQFVFVKDETGKFLLANEAVADAYGTTVGDLEEAADVDFADSEEEVEQFRADDQAVIESGEPKHIPEELLTTADGETRLLKTTKIPYDPVETDGDAVLGVSHDITERKERENMLRQYQYAYESALSGIAIVGLDGELMDVNPTFLDMWGYDDEDDVLGRPAIDLWKNPEQARSVLEAVKERGSWEGELEAVRADGSAFYARGVNSHLTDSDGNSIGVVSSFFDITERKERETELEMQSAAMEASMDGIAVQNEDGRYIYTNQAHADVFGYDADELLGSTWRRLYGDDEIARLEQDVFPVLECEGEWRGEAVGKRRDGTPVHQEITLSLVDDGKLICTNRDITGRKEREQELQMIRERFERFTGNVQDAFFLLPADYSETEYVNPAVETIYGITPEEAYDDPTAWVRHIHPDDQGELLVDVEAQQDGTSEWPLEQEFRIDHPDRGMQWVRARLDVITDEDGDPSWVTGVTTAITDLKEREHELERKQGFLEQTQNVANVGGWEIDLRTDSLRWTEEVYRIHGVDVEFEPTVEDGIEFYHPDDRDTIRDAVTRVTTRGEPYDLELRIVTADGEVRWIHARGEPRYENDEIVGVRGTFQDITERIEREQGLERKTEELEQLASKYQLQYRTLFREAPVMTILTRSEDGRPIVEDCNRQFAETVGYDPETILGSELGDFYTPESAERLQSGGYSQSLDGQFTREKRELMTIDGEVIEALLRAVPRRTADGEIVGTVAMYIDISERESVKRANERLKEFTRVVSHDLRNPLNVATGRLELAAEECDSDHLDDVEGALDRMGTLIDDLLMLAREGKEVTDAQPVDLATMSNNCWETVETNQAVLLANADRTVRADSSRLRQVFENLFRNAVEHGGADVTVTVGELDDGFYIEDDGPGIPSDERDDVFEAGYSQSVDGTGFGLSIVEQIVNAHGWQIRVTDGVDGGARFEIVG
ncbi:PAS domain S-box protein [Halobellus sp. Atlit-31R]|nr:PAS domain S-box protein [Halobellus sp. Atlit-31R]